MILRSQISSSYAESARESDIVTIGIPAENHDIRRLYDVSDAVIFSHDESETSRGIAEKF